MDTLIECTRITPKIYLPKAFLSSSIANNLLLHILNRSSSFLRHTVALKSPLKTSSLPTFVHNSDRHCSLPNLICSRRTLANSLPSRFVSKDSWCWIKARRRSSIVAMRSYRHATRLLMPSRRRKSLRARTSGMLSSAAAGSH